MKQSPWNSPSQTWRLGSFRPPTERRKAPSECRRESGRRATLGERRKQNRRSLRSLFRL